MSSQNSAYRAERNRAQELWMALPKKGRTLGDVSMAGLLSNAGLKAQGQLSRVDDYCLTSMDDVPPLPTRVRVLGCKSKQAVAMLADNMIDCAIVGGEVVKEFNLRVQNERMSGIAQISRMTDLGLGQCQLMIAVREDDTVATPQDLNGCVIVTKYPNLVKNWAAREQVKFKEIVDRIKVEGDLEGGIEGFTMFKPEATVIADMVQSGESLVQNGWRPLGIEEKDWQPVRDGYLSGASPSKCSFETLDRKVIAGMSGLVTMSSALLVRNSKLMSDAKEESLWRLSKQFRDAAVFLGAEAKPIDNNVRNQVKRNRQLRNPGCRMMSAGSMVSHGLVYDRAMRP